MCVCARAHAEQKEVGYRLYGKLFSFVAFSLKHIVPSADYRYVSSRLDS